MVSFGNNPSEWQKNRSLNWVSSQEAEKECKQKLTKNNNTYMEQDIRAGWYNIGKLGKNWMIRPNR
jgi:hypothetical protein